MAQGSRDQGKDISVQQKARGRNGTDLLRRDVPLPRSILQGSLQVEDILLGLVQVHLFVGGILECEKCLFR